MKDESARDKAIENLVSDKLRARSTAGNGCPDEEIVAAYFERSLAPKERLRWEAHFDTCAKCQHRIAALVRMDEAGEASISKPVAKVTPQPRRFSVLRWAWAAPVLLVALVAGLWYTGEFDSFMDRHAKTAERAAVAPRQNQTQLKPAVAETPQKESPAENRVAGLQAGTAKASQASGTTTAKDELRAPQSAPTASIAVSRPAMAPPPPPPPPKTVLDNNEVRDKGLETASATHSAEGGPGQVQSLPLAGRNAAGVSAEEQKQGSGAGQDASTDSRADASSSLADRAAPKTEPEALSVGGAVEESKVRTENAPAPAPPPAAATTAEVESRSATGSLKSKLGLVGGLFKKATPPQTSAGTLKGTVRDPSGAAIPGATVIAINNNTKVAKVYNTDISGEYRASDLNPGEYTIQAIARGFETSLKKDVPLVARADRQEDFSLQVGAVTQTVAVEAAAPALQTVTPQWRVGPHGLIEKRSGQEEWQTIPSGVSVDLYSITFPSRETGWAVGQRGTILRSANGGESWGRVASPSSEDLIRVRATSAESAEVTTRSGSVFGTSNGAATWTRIDTAQ